MRILTGMVVLTLGFSIGGATTSTTSATTGGGGGRGRTGAHD